MRLLKNAYDAKLPKAIDIVVFKIGLSNSLSYIYQAYVVMFIIVVATVWIFPPCACAVDAFMAWQIGRPCCFV
jgi:hypothetical protein